jgi:outer membrane protein OmpA-like peptidoglycan-associated protein
MKNIVLVLTTLFVSAGLSAQELSLKKEKKSKNHGDYYKGPKKTNDQVLPQWAIEFTYGQGNVANTIAAKKNIGSSYLNALADSSFGNLDFASGKIFSYDGRLIYYFNKKRKLDHTDGMSRKFGICTGISYQQHTGIMGLDAFKVSYEAKDNNTQTFRQILTNNGKITDTLTTKIYNVPLMLVFKHQLGGLLKGFGVGVETGALFGIKNTVAYSAAGAFNYEGIYNYDGGPANFDNTAGGKNTSIIYTDNYLSTRSNTNIGDGSVGAFLEDKFSQGFNLGLNKSINKNTNGTTKYTETSFGFRIAPQITYQLNYNLSFVLGGFYNYQVFKNNNSTYKITDRVGDYNAMVNGIQKNIATSYGANVGFRFYFGERKDSDGDGFYDRRGIKDRNSDECIEQHGTYRGCPDRDDDKVPDEVDKCREVSGKERTNGCPDDDGDGFADVEGVDKCIGKYGDNDGCPRKDLLKILADQEGLMMLDKDVPAPTVIPVTKDEEIEIIEIRKDYINFEFKMANILETDKDVLEAVIATLEKNPSLLVLVTGHTDNVGSELANFKLSRQRAIAVKDYLNLNSIPEDRIIIVGEGKEKPIADNKDEQGRAANRRTELKLIKLIKKK